MTSIFDTNQTFTAEQTLQLLREPPTEIAEYFDEISYYLNDIGEDESDPNAVDDFSRVITRELAQAFGMTAKDARLTITFTNGARWAVDRWPAGGWCWSVAAPGSGLEKVDDSLDTMLDVTGEIDAEFQEDGEEFEGDLSEDIDERVIDRYEAGGVNVLDFFDEFRDSAPEDMAFTSIEFSTPAKRSF